MMQTLEAKLDESGYIHFLEPVRISGMRRVLVTLLDSSNESTSAIEKKTTVRGAMEGGLSSVEDIIVDKADACLSADRWLSDINFSGGGNGVVMRAFLAAHRLPTSAMMRVEEIDAQIEAERNAWE